MSHKAIYCFPLCAILAMHISCSKADYPNSFGGTSAGIEPVTEQITDTYEGTPYLKGSAVVLLSEKAVGEIEALTRSGEPATKASGLKGIGEEIGVKGMHRVFPDAGEFEPRTRKEGLHRYYYIEFDDTVPMEKAESVMLDMEGVETLEFCPKCKMLGFNDTFYPELWAFNSKYGINVEPVWKYTTGNPSVIVCVVDQGVELDHPDLSSNTGKADHFNFVTGERTIVPGDHGTHVAGTIAATGNNKLGVAGIAGGNYQTGLKGVSIMSSQFFMDNKTGNSAEAIKWGADHGAVISQNSWGYDYDSNGDGKLSDAEKAIAMKSTCNSVTAAAIDYFIKYAGCDNFGRQLPDSPMKGGLVFFSAGNDGIANGAPANYPPVIAVAATQSDGAIASYSDYGDWVDICAPGTSIHSTVVNGKYKSLSGTSMSCPHASGAAALLLSYFGKPGFTNTELEDILIAGANPDLIRTEGHPCGPFLDVYSSLKYGMKNNPREDNKAPVIETEYSGDFIFKQWEDISIPFKVIDPEDDDVTVSADIEGRAQLIYDEASDSYIFTLICELVDVFTPHKVKISASDIFGASTEYEFTYTVLKNNAPTASHTLPDMIVTSGGSANTVNLSSVFDDVDGETLRYFASVDNTDMADVYTDGANLFIEGKKTGLSTVTVYAKDKLSTSDELTFKLLSRELGSDFEIYPNPVIDILHIRTGIQVEDAHISLRSSNGSLVYEGTVQCSAFTPGEIDMKAFAPGRYKMHMELSGNVYDGTIIKK